MQDIPCIRLEDYNSPDQSIKQQMIQTLGDGLCTFGFVKVTAHGVSPTLYQSAYEQFKEIFALSEKEKKAFGASEDNARGYTPFGLEHAKDNPYPDLKEFWQVGQEIPENDPEYSLYFPNVWTKDRPAFKETVLELYHSLESCAMILAEAFALYFQLPKDQFSSMIKRGDSVLRAIHYPPITEGVEKKQVRAAAHEDINLMTLLPQSEGAGLELLSRDGSTWLPLNASQGDLILDTGDMMSRITNNIVPATTHRVVNPPEEKNEARYAMPFFIHPYPHCDLSVLEHFTSEDNPAKYPPITAREFLQERLFEIGLKKDPA